MRRSNDGDVEEEAEEDEDEGVACFPSCPLHFDGRRLHVLRSASEV